MMKFSKRSLFAMLCISAALLTIVVITPLGVDDMIYRSMTLDLLRLGRIPYIGSWDQNFPGIIIIHYLSILLFGELDISIRIFDFVLQLSFAFLFYRLCRFWLSERASSITSLLYIIYYVTGRGSLYCERDVYGIMAVVAGVYFILRGDKVNKRGNAGRGAWPEFMLSGLLVGFAILIRPTFGLAYVLLAAFILILQNPESTAWTRWRPVILYGIMGAVPFIALLIFYSTIPGGLQAFYLSTIRFNLDVYTSLHVHFDPLVLLAVFFWRGFLIPLAILGLIVFRNKNRPMLPILRIQENFVLRSLTRNELLLYCSLLFSFLGIAFIQGNYLAYHFAPFYLLLCPFSAIGLEWAMEHVRGWILRSAVVLLFGSVYFFFLIGERRDVAEFVMGLFKGENPIESAYAGLHKSPEFGAVPERMVLHYLSLKGNNTGSIEVCSFDPALRVHLQKKFAGIYVLPTAIALGKGSKTLGAPRFTDYQIAWRRAYMDSLRIIQPRFIIIARNTVYWDLHDPYLSYLHALPGFDSLLLACYHYDTTFGSYQIFRRTGE